MELHDPRDARVLCEGLCRLTQEFEVVHYIDGDKDIFQDWLDSLRDVQGRIAILRRINRLQAGNFGDHHFCRDEVSELVLDQGPGYRVYYSLVGEKLVLLLCAGAKGSQGRDIDRAVTYLKKYKEVSQG